MSNPTLEIVLILLLILANGVLAMAEIAIVSVRKARLQRRAEAGDVNAQAALKLANEPSDFLSTVQIGITLVGILAGAFGGATVARTLADVFAEIPAIAPYSSTIALVLVVIAITYLSLVLGELAPKRLSLNNPERIAVAVARPMNLLARIMAPVVRLLSFSTDLVLRIFGVRLNLEPSVTEEEIRVLIEQGTEAGLFEEAEQDMVEGVFRLGDRRIGTIMTPRHEILWLDLEDPPEETRRKITESVHSRFPVARGDLDNIQGVVQAKKLLVYNLDEQKLDVEACLEDPVFVPESMPALKVMEVFRETGQQLVLVIDEFGGLQGLVTTTDILETIVGELPMVGEISEPEIIQREDGTWLLDGMLPVDEFKEFFRAAQLPGEEKGYYQTLGGFVMNYLGRIPKSGDHFEWNGLRFEIIDMDGFRVDKLLVVPVSPAPPTLE